LIFNTAEDDKIMSKRPVLLLYRLMIKIDITLYFI